MKTIATLIILATGAAASPASPGEPDTSVTSRDRLVASLGEDARGFIRRFGVPGYRALKSCDLVVARHLVRHARSGGLDGLAHPERVMNAVAASGDRGARFVLANVTLLANPDAVDVFASDPLEFAHGYRDLPAAVASWKAHPLRPCYALAADWRCQAGAAALALAVFALVARRNREDRPCQPTALTP